MFMIEIRGMRCLYTGDYSRVPDRHMPAADLPLVPPNIVIVESTFGTSNHLPREDRERSFQNKVCRDHPVPSVRPTRALVAAAADGVAL
jgi:cleavage and polyadenylation specificity factor subunit 3